MKHILRRASSLFFAVSLLLSPGLVSAATDAELVAQLAALTKIVADLTAQVDAQFTQTVGGSPSGSCTPTPPVGNNPVVSVLGAISPTSATIAPGNSAIFSVIVSGQTDTPTGFTSLRVAGLPFGVTWSFNPSLIPVAFGRSETATLTICVGQNAPYGDFYFQVGDGGGRNSMALGKLTITRVATTGGSIASGIQSMTPTEVKEVKLFPDIIGIPEDQKAISDGWTYSNVNAAENGGQDSVKHLSLTNVPLGQKPALVTDVMYSNSTKSKGSNAPCTDSDTECDGLPLSRIQSNRGNVAGPRYFSLTDPMSPTLDFSKIWNISTSDTSGRDWANDYGGKLHLGNSKTLFSADGTYSAGITSQTWLMVSEGSRQHAFVSRGLEDLYGAMQAESIEDIIQTSNGTYLIGSFGNDEDSVKNLTGFQYRSVIVDPDSDANRRTANYAELQPNPDYIPTLPNGAAIVGDRLASLISYPRFVGYAADGRTPILTSDIPELGVYSLAKKDPLARIRINNIPLSATGNPIPPDKIGGFVTPEGYKYIYILIPESTSSDGVINKNKLYLYRVKADETALIPIVEGIDLDMGHTHSIVGLSVGVANDGSGGNRAIMIINQTPSPATYQPHIYLLSDLAKSTPLLRDVYTGPDLARQVQDVVSYMTGNTTYVYTSIAELGNRLYVWKFDANSLNVGSVTPPPGGGGPTGIFCGGVVGAVYTATSPQVQDWMDAVKTALIASGAQNVARPNFQGTLAAQQAGWTRGQYVAYYVWRYGGTDIYTTFQSVYDGNGTYLFQAKEGDKLSIVAYINAGNTPPGSGCGIISSPSCTAAPGTFGCFEITPASVRDGNTFNITLKNVNQNVSPSDTQKLHIASMLSDTPLAPGTTPTYGPFQDFGDWYDVQTFLSPGKNYTLSCSAYTSYTPGSTVNITGKYLYQKLYSTLYSNSGGNEWNSSVAYHEKVCGVPLPPGGGGGGCPTGQTNPFSVATPAGCVAVAGCGVTESSCMPKYIGCVSNSCQYINGVDPNPGANSCAGKALGTACTSSGGGDFCRAIGINHFFPPEFCP